MDNPFDAIKEMVDAGREAIESVTETVSGVQSMKEEGAELKEQVGGMMPHHDEPVVEPAPMPASAETPVPAAETDIH